MQKLATTSTFILFTFLLSSLANFSIIKQTFAGQESLKHSVNGGKYHKSGSLTFQIVESLEDEVVVKIDYSLKKKRWYPIPKKVLKGSDTVELPKMFSSEEGYIKLRDVGSMTLEKATVNFIQNIDYKGFYDCYQISVIPSNGKWKGVFLYHPDIPSIGWAKADITFYDIPIIKSYQMTSQIKENQSNNIKAKQ